MGRVLGADSCMVGRAARPGRPLRAAVRAAARAGGRGGWDRRRPLHRLLVAALALTPAAGAGRAAPAAQSDPPWFETPPCPVDYLDAQIDLTLMEADIRARRMRGVVTYLIRARDGGAKAERAPAGAPADTEADRAAADAEAERAPAGAEAERAPAGADEGGERPVGGPTDDALRTLTLDCVGLNVAKVELARGSADDDADWSATTYEATNAKLIVDLEPRLAAGERMGVRVTYSVERPTRGLHFVLPGADDPDRPIMVYTQAEPLQARYWLPCHDWPDTRWPSSTRITVCEPYRAVAVGEPVGVERAADVPRGVGAGERGAAHAPDGACPAGHAVTYRFRQADPIDPHMFGLAVGEFRVLEHESGGRTFETYVHPRYEAAARYSLRRVPEMLDFYASVTGVEYPWPRMAHAVVVNHFHGGMEHVGLDFVSPSLLTESDAGDVAPEVAEFNYVAHMLAHQWFGGLVNYRRITEAWLNEGFATWLHELWRTRAYSYDPPAGGDAPDRASADWYVLEMWETAQRIGALDTPASAPLVNEAIREPDQVYAFEGGKIYWKGAWVVHMLRHELGADAFRAGVRSYLTRHRLGSATTADLRRAFEEASGRDLSGFFEQWVHRGGTPRIEVAYAWNQAESSAALTVTQKQRIDDAHPPMRFPLEVYFGFGEEGIVKRIEVGEATQSFSFALFGEPRVFCVDPYGALLARVEETKPAEAWRAQARGGPTALARAAAVEHLKGEADARDVDAVAACLSDAALFWGVRARAATALGQLDVDAARDRLLDVALRPNEHPRVRSAVLEALSRFEGSPDVHRALLRAAGPDAHVLVRAAALRGLSRCRADAALAEETVRALEAAALPGGSRRVRAAALDALERVNDAGVCGALIAAGGGAADDDPALLPDVLRLIVKLAIRHEACRGRAAELLARHVEAGPASVRVAAIEGLGAIGDEGAIALLEPLAGDDQPSRVRRAARSAIRRLRGSADSDSDADSP